MFTKEELEQSNGCRMNISNIEAVMLKAGLELLGVLDIDTYVGYELTQKEIDNFIFKKINLQNRLCKRFK